jgi:hypothetical protein
VSLFSGVFNVARNLAGRSSPSTAPASPPSVIRIPGATRASHAQPPASNGQQMAEQGLSLPKVTILPPAQLPPGSIEALALEYFGAGGFIRGRFNFRFPLSQQIVDSIVDAEKAAGPLWSAEEIAAQKADFANSASGQELLAEYNFANIGILFRKKMDSISRAVANGERPEPPPPVDRYQQETAISQYRQAVRAGMAPISKRTYDRLLPKCERLRERARLMVVARDKQERSEAAKTGLQFEASALLKSLLFFAVSAWQDEVSNYFPGETASLMPVNTFFGRRLFEIELTQSQQDSEAQRLAILADGERMLREHREYLAQKQAETVASQSASHREQLDRINILHDTLRAEAAASKPERLAVPVMKIL